MICFLLGSDEIITDEHHIVMQSKGGTDLRKVHIRTDLHQGLHRAYNNPSLRDAYLSQLSDSQRSRALFLFKSLDLELKSKKTKKITVELSITQYNKLVILAETRRSTPTKLLQSIVDNI